jgi:hypothetical protein
LLLQASLARASAAAEQQEQEVARKSRAEQDRIEAIRTEAEEERATLADEARRVAGERAALEKSRAYVQDLLSAHGPLEMLGTKEAVLGQRYTQLESREAQARTPCARVLGQNARVDPCSRCWGRAGWGWGKSVKCW